MAKKAVNLKTPSKFSKTISNLVISGLHLFKDMLQNESRLLVGDNSGAKELLIIRCLGGSNRKFSGIGDRVVATVKKTNPQATSMKKGQKVLALIVTSRKGFQRENGQVVKFSKNYAILMEKDGQLVGTRILVPILREFDSWGYKKLFSLAKEIV